MLVCYRQDATLTYKDGTTKGNCDVELVLQAMIDFDRYDKAVIVTGDGDFQCLGVTRGGIAKSCVKAGGLYENQTFSDEEIEKVDVQEIWSLLNEITQSSR